MPKTFETFLKRKAAGDGRYEGWKAAYRQANALEKYSRVRYHEDGTVVVTDTWKEHRSIPNFYRPNAVVQTQFSGQHGEHGHDFIRDESGKIIDRTQRELKDWERKENGDIL